MIRKEIYDYLIEWIANKIENESGDVSKTLRYVKGNKKPSGGVTAHLTVLMRQWVCECREHLFLIDENDNLYVYNQKYFERVDEKELFMEELMRRVLKKIGASPLYQEVVSGSVARQMLKGLSCSDETLFEPDRNYIVFRNGVFDLTKRTFIDFKPKIKTDLILDFDYKSHDDALLDINGKENVLAYKLWFEKINEIIPNPAVCKCFQELCGSMLSDHRKYRKEYFGILIGPGSNGKSVVVNALSDMFGDAFVGRYTLQQLFRGQRADRYVADLSGKVVNICDDMNQMDFASGDFKRFVSGDKIQCMKAYGRKPMLVPAPPLLGCTNAMPESSDESWAYYRRILQIQTTQIRYGEDAMRDARLPEKLRTEPAKQAIFNWLLEGMKRFEKNGGEVEIPLSVKQAMMETMSDSTPVRRWLKDEGYLKPFDITYDNEIWERRLDLHKSFDSYCRNEERLKPSEILTPRSLSATLKAEGYDCKQTRDGLMFRMGRKQTEPLNDD